MQNNGFAEAKPTCGKRCGNPFVMGRRSDPASPFFPSMEWSKGDAGLFSASLLFRRSSRNGEGCLEGSDCFKDRNHADPLSLIAAYRDHLPQSFLPLQRSSF